MHSESTAASAGAAESAACDELAAFVSSLLPVRNLRSALAGLAFHWRRLSAAEAVFVSTMIPAQCEASEASSQMILRGHFFRPGAEPQLIDERIDCPGARDSGWRSESARAAMFRGLSNVADDFQSTDEPVAVVFALNAHAVGGALLFKPIEIEPTSSPWREYADLSGLVLKQAVLIDDDCPPTVEDVVLDPEKLEAMAEFAAGAGHEINNPLATIIGRAKLLIKDEPDPDRRRMLATIGAQAYRARDMIGDAMLFGRPPEPRIEPVELAEAIHAAIKPLAAETAARGCTTSVAAKPGLVVAADSVQLPLVIAELVRNAVEACDDGGEVEITTRSVERHGRPFALIRVRDRGLGFTPKERRHLFDPFFSGRQAGRGLGFGLSKAWRIITNHGGRIEVASPPDGPTTVEVHWPVAKTDAVKAVDAKVP